MATIFVPLPSTTTTTSVALLLPHLEAMLLKTGLGHLQPNTSDPRMREGIVVSPSLFVVQIQTYTSVMVHWPQSSRCISPHSFGVVGCGPRLVHPSISLSESIYLSFLPICSLFYLSSIMSHRIREIATTLIACIRLILLLCSIPSVDSFHSFWMGMHGAWLCIGLTQRQEQNGLSYLFGYIDLFFLAYLYMYMLEYTLFKM